MSQLECNQKLVLSGRSGDIQVSQRVPPGDGLQFFRGYGAVEVLHAEWRMIPAGIQNPIMHSATEDVKAAVVQALPSLPVKPAPMHSFRECRLQ